METNFNFKKYITHNGRIHSDEPSGFVFIRKKKEVPFQRVGMKTDFTKKGFYSPNVVLADIGRRYSPGNLNFDHHHNNKLWSSHELIRLSFAISLNPQQLKRSKHISKVDNGLIILPYQIPKNNAPEVIKALELETDSDFETAANICESWIYKGKIPYHIHKLAVAKWQNSDNIAKDKFKEVEHCCGYIINKVGFIAGWQTRVPKNVFAMVAPSVRVPGEWILQSVNSRKYPLPESFAIEASFFHNSQFLASYSNKELAILKAKKMYELYK